MSICCFVINMKDATARWSHIENEFALAGLSPQRFKACTSDDLPRFQLPWTMDDFVRERWTLGEIGCFLSHLAIWQHMIDNKVSAVAIFEDDVIFGRDAHRVINELDFDQSPHVKKLETKHELCFLSKNSNGSFRTLLSPHMGTAAYALNISAAREFISMVYKRPVIVDLLVFGSSIGRQVKLEQAYPAVAMQEGFLPAIKKNQALASSLAEERWVKLLSMREGILAKVRRRILNMFSFVWLSLRGERMRVPMLDKNGELYLGPHLE